jgi:hypothetical protein
MDLGGVAGFFGAGEIFDFSEGFSFTFDDNAAFVAGLAFAVCEFFCVNLPSFVLEFIAKAILLKVEPRVSRGRKSPSERCGVFRVEPQVCSDERPFSSLVCEAVNESHHK